MSRRILRTFLGAAVLVLTGCGPSMPTTAEPQPMDHRQSKLTVADASASPITFEQIAAFPPPGWNVPRSAQVSPDGKLVTYLQSESGGEEMALFAFEVASRKHAVLVRASDLQLADRPMSRAEELRRERQRKRITGVTAYAWAKKAPVLLLPLGGDVFVRGADGAIRQLTDSPAPEIDPQLCDDGSLVAFARGSELFVVEVESGRERQLTRDAPEGVTRGQSDYIMQEEFGEPSGFWWSPGCDRIAYFEVDEREVKRIPILGYRGGVDLQELSYPRAGGSNPTSRLGVVDLKSGRTTWVELPAAKGFDAKDDYVGRIAWSRDRKTLYAQRLSRRQQQLALLAIEPATGKARHLLEEQESTWLELSRMEPLEDGRLLWVALRDGHRHLELRQADGQAPKRLTRGDWDVFDVVGVDRKNDRVLFIANRDAPLDRQLYAVALEGGEITRLSEEPGVHEIAGSRPELGWVDIHSALDRPPRAVIRGPDGRSLGDIEVPKNASFDAMKLRTPKIVTVAVADGPPLYGALLEPRQRAPGARHPAIVMVYGGPGVQTVLNEFNPRALWHHLADRGFAIFQLDNRGSSGRGHAFETPIYRRCGEVELADQLRGLDYLTALDFVDPERVGIYGHSYGGYMAAMAMLRAPGRFQVGVAGSPVTDWRLYDTGYTERFMSTPEDNAQGYEESALLPHAGKLEGKLFLIHALMDENVHFEHTALLIDALVAAGKPFDTLVFPGERHGYRGKEARTYAYRRVVEYFVDNL
jgi:dipeptidyl-peptidase-4